MGSSYYNSSDRNVRAAVSGYHSVTTDNMGDVFKQKSKRMIHTDMDPKNLKNFRESRDSEIHPNTVPVQLYLDVTGSMGEIPVHLIKEGLPKLISSAIQRGVPDISLMFGAIGDHECDNFPLQLGQFESGDAELDMWLERVYPEMGGGGNAGESYGLAWFTASRFIETDAWDKRQQKGFVFTIGDEPSLINYPGSMLKSLFGSNLPQVNNNYTLSELFQMASEKNHVYHIHVNHNGRQPGNFRQVLGNSLIETSDHTEIPNIIVNKMMEVLSNRLQETTPGQIEGVETLKTTEEENGISKPKITL